MSIELHYFNVLVATVRNKRRVEIRCCSRSDKPIFYCRIEEERNTGNFDNRRYAVNRDSFRDTMILAMKLSEIETKAVDISKMEIGTFTLPPEMYYRGSIIGL